MSHFSCQQRASCLFYIFFFNDTATTEIYTRSIVGSVRCVQETVVTPAVYQSLVEFLHFDIHSTGQKSHCVNTVSGHHLSLIHISEPTRPLYISYAVFCLKKKKKKNQKQHQKNTRKKQKQKKKYNNTQTHKP
eukprot:TRINITY_DN12649_c0_g1_i10.p1 TRINITY_DN12649_c0_g1~~TRINITY_DN12649_c0_g1_i10.p1  ORF type:complete len:133 (+),score=30.56 TRINITY_DN12649_c0_g1_i10:34-432(+)